MPIRHTWKVVTPGEESLKVSRKEAAVDKVSKAARADEEKMTGEEALALAGVGKPNGKGKKSKAAASAVTEKKKTEKEAGKRRRDDKKLVDVDTSKNSKKVRGKKTDNDEALKDTVDVDDSVHVKKHNIMLVFPFVTGIAIETATCHLKLCYSFYDYKDEAYERLSDGDVVELQAKLSNNRNQLVSITEDNIKTVEPGKLVNDNIVDFWMHWFQRKELPNKSHVHIFSTHFYTELARQGYDRVACWTAKKGINIFQKKLILIPINIRKH